MRKTNTDPASILNVFALVIVSATGARGAESDTGMDPLLKPEIRNSPAREIPGLLDKMFAGPLRDVPAVICVLKNNIGGAGIEGDYGWTLHGQQGLQPGAEGLSMAEQQSRLLPTPKFGSGPSKILRVDLRTRQVSTLFEDSDGGVLRDPCVSYDATKILFSMRKSGEIRYHLFEVNVDGTGLRQLTDGPDDEVEPCYLPDGGIVYVSSKAHRYTPCNAHAVGNLWRCDADGGNQRRLTNGMDAERTPWVLSDGRIAFARWDYVHRDQGSYFGLWTINPDGTGHMILSGNYNFYRMGWLAYAKPIPDSNRVVFATAYVHGLTGMVATLDTTKGPDDVTALSITSLGNPPTTLDMVNNMAFTDTMFTNDELHYRSGNGPDGRPVSHQVGWTDPYPISEDCFLLTNVADRKNELCVMDGQGNYEIICSVNPDRGLTETIDIEGWEVELKSSPSLAGVRPLVPRAREPVVPASTDWTQTTGTMILGNIYEGRQFAEVKRGSIKSLMIMENLPTPIRFGGHLGISGGEQYNVTRYLGSVPVEEDGSAHFKVPAVRSLSLIAVDDAGREVKYMRTQVNVMPGEVVGCVGCHEHRTQPPESPSYLSGLLAMKRPASEPQLPAGLRHTPVSYTRDVQPILDRHCVECHSVEKPEGRIVLEGDRTPKWSVAYSQLFAAGQIKTVGNPKVGNDPVSPIAAAASPLVALLSSDHYDVRATEEEILTVRTWINEDAKYGPYSMTSWSGRLHPEDPVPPCDTRILMKRCDSCHVDTRQASPRWDGTIEGDRNGRYCGPNAWPEDNQIYGASRRESLINLDFPEKSLLLLAPLAKEAGGLGWCEQTDAKSKVRRQYKQAEPAVVFKSKDETDYEALLASIQVARDYFTKNIRRFDMPGYRPNRFLLTYMKNWGVLPADYDVSKDGWDAERIDDLYFDHALFPKDN
jgi:hypothetical protein